MISRENYEIWFTDWLDNNLTVYQTDELYAFLDQNDDLRDEFNSLSPFELKPENVLFKGKDGLRKSFNQISSRQFELLCAARAENDLSPNQEMEMREMLSSNDDRSKTAEIFRRLKLQPSDEGFADKGRLLRHTAGRKIIRMAAIGLSAAATIAFLITIGLLKPSLTSPSFSDIAVVSPAEVQQNSSPDPDKYSPVENSSPAENNRQQAENSAAENQHADEVPEVVIKREPVPQKVEFNVSSSLAENLSGNYLAAASVSYIPETTATNSENRSNVGRFLAQTFRSKVLDESSDEPLKAYEIAEAGINGLNKLLGWEMDLSKNNNEKGEVKSVYFSSRMLKFNAPVKNSDVAE